jgi:electron transport complex protein RnfE
VFVVLIAAIVTAIEMTMNAYLHELYLILGIFIPLIVTNCNVLARAEAFASRNAPLHALADGLMIGLGFMAVLIVLGAMREALGQGTILAHANLMFGQGAEWMTVTVFENYHGFLLAILPPGAFIGLGLLVAFKNKIDAQRKRPQTASAPVATPAPSMGH